jgi:hypothetical protein
MRCGSLYARGVGVSQLEIKWQPEIGNYRRRFFSIFAKEITMTTWEGKLLELLLRVAATLT